MGANEKKTIIYCLPKEKYNGIKTVADTVSGFLSEEFIFKKVQMSFLNLSSFKRFAMNNFLSRYTNLFLTQGDYHISADEVEAIKKADLIHFWHPEFAGLFLKKKYIVSCHGIELLPKVCRNAGSSFFFSVFKNAAFIQADSQATKKLILDLVKKDANIGKKIKAIYPCIDVNRFKKNETGHELLRKKRVIGTLSRLVEGKNIPMIINALLLLKRKFQLNFRFILAGDGPEKKAILSRLNNSNLDFTYLGAIPETKKVEKFYHQIDVFVLPTFPSEYNREGFGIVYIEANACGVPVVASRDGGVVEAVKEGNSGLFADFTDPSDIAEKTLMLIRKRGDYTKSTVEWAKKFDVKRQGPFFAHIYRRALKRGAG